MNDSTAPIGRVSSTASSSPWLIDPSLEPSEAGPSRSNQPASTSNPPPRPRSDSLPLPEQPSAKRPRDKEQYARAWETRRKNAWAERVLPTYNAGLDRDSTALPPDFLLDALHRHASTYYANKGLMKDPTKRWMRRIQPNKKRKMLAAAGSIAPPSVASSRIQPTKGATETRKDRAAEGDENHEREEDDEGGEKEDDPARLQRMSSSGSDTDATRDAYEPSEDEDEGQEDEIPTSDLRTPVGRLLAEHVPKERQRGPYIRRDMRNAIRGEGLIVLGVVVEEIIRRELEKAGYRSPSAEDGEQESLSQTLQASRVPDSAPNGADSDS